MCRASAACFVIFFALRLSRGVFGGQLTLSSFTTHAEVSRHLLLTWSLLQKTQIHLRMRCDQVTPLTKRQMSSHEKVGDLR